MPKAVVCRELGPPERLRLETFASVPLGPGEVRVAIHAAGINFPDILMAAGEYQLKPPLPFTPGVEAAGEVTEVSDATEVNDAAGIAVGDKVILKLRHGAYADEAVVTPQQLTPLPSAFDYAEGATFLAGHGTAYHALRPGAWCELGAGVVLLLGGLIRYRRRISRPEMATQAAAERSTAETIDTTEATETTGQNEEQRDEQDALDTKIELREQDEQREQNEQPVLTAEKS